MPAVKTNPTIKDLQKMGYPIVPGNEYIPKKLVPKKMIPLTQVRKILSKIKGSLSQTVSETRDEE